MSQIVTPSWKCQEVPYDSNITLNQVFERQAMLTPNHIAYKMCGQTITYHVLNGRANALSHMFMEHYSICKGKIVAICMKRSIELMTCILAVIKTGAAFCILDKSIPHKRMQYILQDSQASLLIHGDDYSPPLPRLPCLAYDKSALSICNCTPVTDLSSDNTAYVVYTSGSTGFPKGVMISHRSVVNRIHWMINELGLSSQDIFLQKTFLMFDVCIWEILCGLFCGATTVLLEGGQESNIASIWRCIQTEKVTITHFIPTVLAQFLSFVESRKVLEGLNHLRYIISSGEPLSYKTVADFNQLFQASKTQLYNLYGPAEATIDVTFFNCTGYINSDQVVPIGRPIWNTRIYILDRHKQLCGNLQAGEIYISGDNVGKGYIHTNKSMPDPFLPDPFWQGRIMYRTGDCGRWHDDVIEFRGRLDDQIKLKGIRIEPNEIEYMLLAYEDITLSVICQYDDTRLICLYMSDHPIETIALKRYLSEYFPQYMLPALFLRIEKFPFLANGKIDRKQIKTLCRQLKIQELKAAFS